MKTKLLVLTILIVYGCISKEQEILYYPDNSIKSTCTLVDGKRDGLLVEYYPNSTIRSKQHWVNGKLDGELLMYYTNGQLGEQSTYKNGIKSECTFYYFETGGLLEKQCYDTLGRLIDFMRFNKGGGVDYSVSAPIFFLKKDTLNLGETVSIFIRLSNIDTAQIVKKTFFVTSGFTDEGRLTDTLNITNMPKSNDFFKYSIITKQLGLNHIYGRIECEKETDSTNSTVRYSFNQPYFVVE